MGKNDISAHLCVDCKYYQLHADCIELISDICMRDAHPVHVWDLSCKHFKEKAADIPDLKIDYEKTLSREEKLKLLYRKKMSEKNDILEEK